MMENPTPPNRPPLTINEDMMVKPEAAKSEQQSGGAHDFEKGMRLFPALTLLLIAANVVIFIGMLYSHAFESEASIVDAGALSRERVQNGEYWRLFSATFLHGSIDHIFGNMIALYVLGISCERAFGHFKTAVIYLMAGLGGSLLSISFGPGPSVGASGSIFGLMGAMIVFFHIHKDLYILRDRRLFGVLGIWAGYTLLVGFASPMVDNGAHLGGLLIGAALGWSLPPAPVGTPKR